ESRVGETFLLGASTWRIEDITFERVVVTPAPGQPGKMPFWHGDGPGREAELGRALGEFVRQIRSLPPDRAAERLATRHALDARAAANLLAYLDEQAEVTGVVPDDRTDRKSTRLNSSHVKISYAVFCLKKKKKNITSYSY